MLTAIREVGIFIVIAQAILFFVPGESYVKYVKVIVGIIMIVKIAQPVLSLVTDGEWESIMEQALLDSEKYGFGMQKLEITGVSRGIYTEIEEELRRKLKEETPEGYEVSEVELRENGIVITVAGKEAEPKLYEYLKEQYGRLLGMEASDVEIRTDGRKK